MIFLIAGGGCATLSMALMIINIGFDLNSKALDRFAAVFMAMGMILSFSGLLAILL